MEKKLPDNFYWGGSVSSFQTEGARNEGGKAFVFMTLDQLIQNFLTGQ